MSKNYFKASLALPAFQAMLGLPLWLGLIPPNRVYGYRTEQSLGSTGAWYDLNQSAGLLMVCTALLLLGVVVLIWKAFNWQPTMKLAACGISLAVSTLLATALVG